MKHLIGELRQSVQNLSNVDPVLKFFETRIRPMELAAEMKDDALDIAFREHRKDMVALKKVHEEERTERRRRMEDFLSTANPAIEGNTR